MARTTSHDEPAEEAPAKPSPEESQAEVNRAMEETAVEEAPSYPAGADVVTAQNVRRYPELFTDEQIASVDAPAEE